MNDFDLWICPRCKDKAMEYQKSYVSCYSCNYSPDLDAVDNFDPNANVPIPAWALDAIKEVNFDQNETEKTYDSNLESQEVHSKGVFFENSNS